MTTITRLYDSHERAAGAVNELLKNDDFSGRNVRIIAPGSDSVTTDNVMSAVSKAGVYPAAAATYADHLRQGGALVVVQAPFGCAHAAKDALDKHGPTSTDVKHTAVHTGTSSSSRLINNKNLPILVPRDTLIFSGSVTGALSKKSRARAGLTKNATPLSSALGLPLLNNKPPKAKLAKSATPLSSMLGLPTLSKKKSRGRTTA